MAVILSSTAGVASALLHVLRTSFRSRCFSFTIDPMSLTFFTQSCSQSVRTESCAFEMQRCHQVNTHQHRAFRSPARWFTLLESQSHQTLEVISCRSHCPGDRISLKSAAAVKPATPFYSRRISIIDNILFELAFLQCVTSYTVSTSAYPSADNSIDIDIASLSTIHRSGHDKPATNNLRTATRG